MERLAPGNSTFLSGVCYLSVTLGSFSSDFGATWFPDGTSMFSYGVVLPPSVVWVSSRELSGSSSVYRLVGATRSLFYSVCSLGVGDGSSLTAASDPTMRSSGVDDFTL